MNPAGIGAVLVAVAGGAGGALGAQLRAGACALVCRPFRQGKAAVPGGKAERAAPQQVLADQRRAMVLARSPGSVRCRRGQV